MNLFSKLASGTLLVLGSFALAPSIAHADTTGALIARSTATREIRAAVRASGQAPTTVANGRIRYFTPTSSPSKTSLTFVVAGAPRAGTLGGKAFDYPIVGRIDLAKNAPGPRVSNVQWRYMFATNGQTKVSPWAQTKPTK